MERRPDPPPMETNDVEIVAGGIILWTVGLVVLLVLKKSGQDIHNWWWQMCLTGALLGLVGLRYCVRRRASLNKRV